MAARPGERARATGAGATPSPVPGPLDSPATPEWLVRSTSIGVRLALLGGVVWLGAVLAAKLTLLVVPLAVAALLAGASVPLVRWGDRRRVPRWVSSLVVVLGLLAAAGGVAWGLGESVAAQLPQLRQQAVSGADDLLSRVGVSGGVSGALERATSGSGSGSGEGSSSGVLSGLGQVAAALSTAFEVLVGVFLTLAFTFLFLKDGSRLWGWCLSKVRPSRRDQAAAAGEAAWSTLGTYVRGLTIVSAFDAVGIGLGLLLLGVPLVLTLAVLQFVLSYIPTIGALVAGAVAVVVALAAGGPTTAGLTLLVVVVVQQLGNSVIEPWVMGKGLKIHPVVVLGAVTAGGVLWGIPGALLAVPVVAAVAAGARGASQVAARPELGPAQEPA